MTNKYKITDFNVGDVIVWEWGQAGDIGNFLEICQVYAIRPTCVRVKTLYSTTDGNVDYTLENDSINKESFYFRNVFKVLNDNVDVQKLCPEYLI